MRLRPHGTRLWGFRKPTRDRTSGQPAVRKVAREGTRHAVATHDGLRFCYAVAVPRSQGPVEAQAGEVLAAITSAFASFPAPVQVLRRVVFAAPENLESCRRAVAASDASAAIDEYVPQSPADGSALAVEAWGVLRDSDELDVERRADGSLVLRHLGVSWFHCGGIELVAEEGQVYTQSMTGLETMAAQLKQAGTSFESVVRTWLYLGDIVGPELDTQRYKELNRARSDVFVDLDFAATAVRGGQAYPASTGIGTDGRGIVMSAIAIESKRRDVQAVALENPRQTAACDYGTEYSPKSPKFSRAMAVSSESGVVVYVSGTASITASETRHENDAEAQTRETLDNIAALISEENLGAHGMAGVGATLADVAVARVYVKHAEDYAAIRAICEDRLGSTPTCYTIADVCRSDLLVEIEAIAYAEPYDQDAR